MFILMKSTCSSVITCLIHKQKCSALSTIFFVTDDTNEGKRAVSNVWSHSLSLSDIFLLKYHVYTNRGLHPSNTNKQKIAQRREQ